eukprot:TRINITY_DN11400_c0_g1_i2.p3 TRINITY_DN11400_c0_g1~~TRINITY_DN11400_c0_g1_i2.p3  ORF type:complete len:302 (+),score=39.07 TRINITY_DN11400_c0_g1_i2:2315-3220(+)
MAHTSGLQIASVPIIFALGLVSAFLPRWLRVEKMQGSMRLQLSICFAAGVFIAAGFLHLLPDAIEGGEAHDQNFPFTCLTVLAGFVSLFLFEYATGQLIGRSIAPHTTVTSGQDRPSEAGEHSSLLVKSAKFSAKDDMGMNLINSQVQADPLTTQANRTYIALCLTIALSVHSCIAGLALGASSAKSSVAVFFAIIAHKGLAGFALGVEIRTSPMKPLLQLLAVFVFAFATPIGIVAGILTAEQGDNLSYVQAFAAGTFLEIGGKHMASDMERHASAAPIWSQVLTYIVGVASMGVLAIWV